MFGLSPRERRENIRDAYALCCSPALLEGKTVLVADDVLTTGATLSECARMLKKKGAARVYGICAAAARDGADR